MSKHTPEPWYRQQDNDDPSFFIIRNNEGSKIATLHDPLADELAHAEELVANAALIAAAPELLEACKAAQKYLLLPEGQRGDVREILQLLGKAGIKAEGNT